MKGNAFAAAGSPRARSLGRGAVSILCVVLLAACSARPDAMGQRGFEQLASPGQSTRLWLASFASAEYAPAPLARLSNAAGKVREVRQHIYSNGLRQTIILDSRLKGPLTSGIEIEIQIPNQRALDDPLSIEKPTEAGVRSQIDAIFRTQPMRIVSEPRANRYGTYGLAAGKSTDGIRCIFAWQWIDPSIASERVPIDGTIALRLHLCDKDATLDQLAGYVDELQLRAGGFADAVPTKTVDPRRGPPSRVIAGRNDTADRSVKRIKQPNEVILPVTGATAYLAPVPADISASPAPGFRATTLDTTLPVEALRGPSTGSISADTRR